MATRRGNQEGSIYQRSSDQRWVGAVLIGQNTRGRPVHKYVTGKSRAEVVRKLKQLRREVDDGLSSIDRNLKVSELLNRWLDDVIRHQVVWSTAKNYRIIATHHIIPALGNKRIADLTVADVDHLLAKKRDDGYAISTVRRVRSVLAQALDQGIRWGLVGRNVATLSRAPRAVRQEGRTLTPEQARHLLHSLKGHRHEALFALMLSTGLRRGEALGLMWIDFNRKTGVLRINRQLKREASVLVAADTKTAGSRRAINLPAPMLDELLKHEKRQQRARNELGDRWMETGFIFTSELGTPMDPRNLYREFQEVCQKAGLGQWHPHELRHSAASLMLAQGIPLQVVSRVLGHSSIRMTADVYGHILDPDREEAANAIGAILWQSYERQSED